MWMDSPLDIRLFTEVMDELLDAVAGKRFVLIVEPPPVQEDSLRDRVSGALAFDIPSQPTMKLGRDRDQSFAISLFL